jgi:hypothetical protein
MKLAGWLLLPALALLAQNDVVTPRAQPTDYPAHAPAKGATLAAAQVPADQQKQIFHADLNRAGYVVFEVAIYPDGANQPDILPADFRLVAPPDATNMRASEPVVVAAAVYPYDKPRTVPPTNVQVYTEANIGYQSGGNGRRGGMYGGGGVGVGVGTDPTAPPASSSGNKDQARNNLEAALNGKALPAGKVTGPTAGYLYFPKAGKKAAKYELTYYGADGTTKLVLKPL